MLIDFTGRIRHRDRVDYPYPTPGERVAVRRARDPRSDVPAGRRVSRTRLVGLGVALPFQLWSWSDEIGAPPGAMDGWRSIAIGEEIGRLCGLPITVCNDATSACAAEYFFGEAWRERDFLYFFIGRLSRRRSRPERFALRRAHRQRGGCGFDAGRRANAGRRATDPPRLALSTGAPHRKRQASTLRRSG